MAEMTVPKNVKTLIAFGSLISGAGPIVSVLAGVIGLTETANIIGKIGGVIGDFISSIAPENLSVEAQARSQQLFSEATAREQARASIKRRSVNIRMEKANELKRQLIEIGWPYKLANAARLYAFTGNDGVLSVERSIEEHINKSVDEIERSIQLAKYSLEHTPGLSSDNKYRLQARINVLEGILELKKGLIKLENLVKEQPSISTNGEVPEIVGIEKKTVYVKCPRGHTLEVSMQRPVYNYPAVMEIYTVACPIDGIEVTFDAPTGYEVKEVKAVEASVALKAEAKKWLPWIIGGAGAGVIITGMIILRRKR